ncbi:MAG: hypothetical protein EOM20_21565 [Spartobacteria bacterium]|nr:hypothetical protein [Spartobacteria bacterium]
MNNTQNGRHKMAQYGTDLTARQKQAIEALLSSSSITEAAKATGIARRTLHRWLSNEAFSLVLICERRTMLDVALNKLRVHVGEAVDTLARLLGDQHSGVQLQAAKTILDMAMRAAERTDVIQRIENLERSFNER